MSAIGTEQEHVSIELNGTPYEVVSLQGREGLSELFRFEVTYSATGDDPMPAELIAADAVITLRDGFGAERTISGIVAEAHGTAGEHAQTYRSQANATIVTVVVRPAVYPLSLGRDCRVFQDASTVDIAKQILADQPAPSRWNVHATYDKHIYCAQYREDDWTFVSRLLEEEGIYYWFDHAAGSTIVFSDTSTGAPELTGGADLSFAYEAGMHQLGETVMELGEEVAATPMKFTVGSFDENKPLDKVEASVGSGYLEIYDAPGGGPEAPGECARQARIMSEAAAAAGAGVFGQASSVRLVPGQVVAIGDHPLERFNRRFLVTAVRYQVQQHRDAGKGDGERAYLCWFRGIPQSTPYRAPRDTPRAKQAGLQSAVVAGPPGEEVYPDDKGRVRVQLHWDREGDRTDKAGKWMRVAQRGVASSMLLPRIGWNVMTFNQEGTVDAPSVLSRVHDGEHPPAYPLPANKTRVVWKTATTPGGGSFNEIYFEDKKGSEEMFWNASKDMSVTALHVKNEGVKHDATRTIGNNHDLEVTDVMSETVKNDQSVTIGADEAIEVSGSQTKNVHGDESATIGGNRKIKTGEQHTINVEGTRTLQVGGSMIEQTTGNVSSASGKEYQLQIGGASLRTTDQSVLEDVGKLSVQTVGGSKFEYCKQSRPLDVKGTYTESIASSMTLETKEHFVEGADKVAYWTVTSAMDSTAPDIYIEASSKIELIVGSSSLTIDPTSVEFKSPSFDLTDASLLEAIAGVITHN